MPSINKTFQTDSGTIVTYRIMNAHKVAFETTITPETLERLTYPEYATLFCAWYENYLKTLSNKNLS